MKYLFELSKEEAIQIEGGSLYSIGKYIGSWWANEVDFIEGVATGIFK
jgi:hypothetical protein